MRGRIGALLVVYLLAAGGVVYRLVDVQVIRAAHFAGLGSQQRARTIELSARRGRIYDRAGEVLATSVDAAAVYADPQAFRPRRVDGRPVPPAATPARVAARLAPLLDTDPGQLERKLQAEGRFVYLARQVDHAVGERIERLDVPGVGVLTEPHRVYPAGPLAAPVLGFAGIDGQGLSGLELAYDGILAGRPGRVALQRAPGGLTIASADQQLVPPLDGTDLVLTLDRALQHEAERAAAAAVRDHDAAAAGVAVVEVATGEILAMASVPGFDPNAVDESTPAHRRNRPVTDIFEPGSVQKAVTAAAALEEGVASPDSVYAVEGKIEIGDHTFSDTHPHPTQAMSVAEIMAKSSNIGTIKMAQQLGAARLARWLKAFGYGQQLGLGFPGEGAGAVPPLERWSLTSLPTIAIGHGVAVTLLQAAHIYATFANDGVAIQPRLVRGTVGAEGRLSPVASGESHRVISPTTARQLRRMLTGVVTRGTGQRAAIPGYTVAGKTGTARKPRDDAAGYSNDFVASFVGLAPASDPRLVVAIMIDEPTPIYGGEVAAPVFRQVMSFALTRLGIAPDCAPEGGQDGPCPDGCEQWPGCPPARGP